MSEHDLMYEDEIIITYISFPIYQVLTVDPMLFCVNTGVPHFCIGDKAFGNIFRHSGRRSILIIDSKREFKFGDSLVRSRGVVEIMLPTPGSTLDITVILDVVDVKIPALPVLDVFYWNNLLADNVNNHL